MESELHIYTLFKHSPSTRVQLEYVKYSVWVQIYTGRILNLCMIYSVGWNKVKELIICAESATFQSYVESVILQDMAWKYLDTCMAVKMF